MLVVGLTGGVGMGKSTVAEFLRRRGESIVDTDLIAREVVAPGSDALAEIRQEFGGNVITADGQLDRVRLAGEVFADEARRKALEAIVHPRIRQRWKQTVEEWRAEGRKRAVIVIPLLFETGAQEELQRTVCVACSSRVQMTRLSHRGWSGEEAWRRVAAQWPIQRKMDLADGVIWNESTVAVCEMQAARLFE